MAQQSAQITFAFLAKDYASKTVRGLSKSLAGLGKVANKVGGGIKTGLTAAGVGIAGVVAGAAAAAVAFTKAAIEDEASQNRLIAVLKKRGLASKENLAATEALIAKGAELAFTDDEVRAGLATATQFTKNFADSQKILATAQEVSRARGISLEEATSLVGKAYQGNTKGLKALGVETKKGAKGLSVLSAVNAKFAGSADAYSKTTEGRMKALQITLAETGEEIGYTLLPIFQDLMEVFAKEGVPIIKGVANGIKEFITNNKELIKSVIGTVVGIGQKLLPILGQIAGFIFTKVVPAIVGFVSKLTAPGGVIDSVMKVVGPIVQNLIPVFGMIIDAVSSTAAKIGELVGVLWGDGKGPLATAVGFLGNLLGFVGKIIANIVGAIGTAIDAVMSLGKAIMDSPIGFIIKAVAGVISGVAGAVGNATGFTSTSQPVAAGTGSSMDPMSAKYGAPPVNVYVGADRVADAVVPVIAKDVRVNPRSGR
jgi:phage-related protein